MMRIKNFMFSVILGVANASALTAEPLRVVADIGPVHSLLSQVMNGVGEPVLLLRPGSSPHDYSLRPSEAAVLQDADAIFWVGHALTPWLEKPLDTLAQKSDVIELLEVENTALLQFRETPSAETDGHDHEGTDPHAWMDPKNAAAWVRNMAAVLIELDPENAAVYRENLAANLIELEDLADEVAAMLIPAQSEQFVVYHDAFQYFENRFGLHTIASVIDTDGEAPSVRQYATIRDTIARANVACILLEPQFDRKALENILEGTDAKVAIVDPLGAGLPLGPALYSDLIRDAGAEIAKCVAGT